MSNKRQRKIIKYLLIGSGIVFVGIITLFTIDRYSSNRSVNFRIEGNYVQINRAKKWQDFIVREASLYHASQVNDEDNHGVNPENNTGNSIAEAGWSKDQYSRWFKQLAAGDSNVVRINTILPPVFYRAFFEYNILTNRPLYLLHGIRLDEQNIRKYSNAYEDKLNSDFFEEIRRTVDVVHGKATFKHLNGASTTYNMNIAPYVMGYMLCESADADFMAGTNQKNPHVMGFEGDYLYTRNASPYEAWLAAVGNYTISYEQEKYGGVFRLVSWTNWTSIVQLEKLDDDDETEFEEVMSVNFNNIQSTEKFSAGILATHHFIAGIY